MKTRKGDLVLIEHNERTYAIGQPSTERTTYRFGMVRSATREGVAKTWSALGYGDHLVSEYGQKMDRGDRVYVLSQKDIDVTAALTAAKAHHWPNHPGQPMPFDSLEEARETVRPFRLGVQPATLT